MGGNPETTTRQLTTVQETQPGRQRRDDPALGRADTQRARSSHLATAKVNDPWMPEVRLGGKEKGRARSCDRVRDPPGP